MAVSVSRAPYAAVAWSLVYAALGVYWAVSGRGFPYPPESASDILGPMIGRFGPGAAWIAVMLAGIPAAAVGAAMLRGVRGRALRPLLITAGVLLAGVLLLFMTALNLLVKFGYIPYAVVGLFTGAKFVQGYLRSLADWATIHQLLCLIGGFLWLAATVCYGRRSAGACLHCGRREDPEGWQRPEQAARWSRIAVYNSGLFLANFGLAGGALMLGLVQRWGEVFPRWMIGLAGRRVPIALAVVPADRAGCVAGREKMLATDTHG